jgi:hypothetical protein
MSNYIEIDTPFSSLKTVKLLDSSSFRPAATGSDYNQTRLRADMERLEIYASSNQRPGFISSAAHTDNQKAISNAYSEAIERVTSAAWWALNRPVMGKLSDIDFQNIINDAGKPTGDFDISIGFIEPINHIGNVAVSIIRQNDVYPYATTGTAFSKNHTEAANKAFIESVQSWTASTWLKKYLKSEAPLWDIPTLLDRIDQIDSSPVVNEVCTENEGLIDLQFEVETRDYAEGKVAWVYAKDRPVSGTTASLASLAMRDGEKIQVFTEHNH